MSYQKLVRDNIPDIIKSNGEIPITRILNDEEYKKELECKLKEEMEEVLLASGLDRMEELADLLEVMISLANIEGESLDDIINICNLKREKRGGFTRRLYLEGVENEK